MTLPLDINLAHACARYSQLAYGDHASFMKACPGKDIAFIEKKGMQAYVVSGEDSNVITFRGTEFGDSWPDFFMNAQIRTVKHRGVNIHRGYLRGYKLLEASIYREIDALGPSKPVVLTGHSLGGALAALASFMLPGEIECITFGSPKVGHGNLAKKLAFHRIVYENDVAPRHPFSFFYRHGGRPMILTKTSLQPGQRYRPIMSFRDHRIANYVESLSNLNLAAAA